ncbi:MAG: hypothetical protein RLZZ196_892 [Bacteroidota bacterium]|jgi:hypothetical protein
MPNLNEFFHKPEIIHKAELEKIHGLKPCSKCDGDAEEAFWDPTTLILAWECPNGHANQVKVN